MLNYKMEDQNFIQRIIDRTDVALERMNNILDQIIKNNSRAKADLYENAISLETFYNYYGIDGSDQLDPFKFINKVVEKIEYFECDKDEYHHDMRDRFIYLLQQHNDRHVSLVASMLTGMRNEECSEGEENQE